MGVRWKRGFCSSCFHHPSASGCWERGRVIAAGVNLPDLFSLTAASLTINLNLPRREEFVHICVLAGGGRNGVVMQCNPRVLLKRMMGYLKLDKPLLFTSSWYGYDRQHYHLQPASVLIIHWSKQRQEADEHYVSFGFFHVLHNLSSVLTCDTTCVSFEFPVLRLLREIYL